LIENHKAVRYALAKRLEDDGPGVMTTHKDPTYKKYNRWIVGDESLEIGEKAFNHKYCK
jgi:hypothetical protein